MSDRTTHDAEMMRILGPAGNAGRNLDPAGPEPLGPMKSMNGRERMRAALARLGFEIR